ncbi:MAG: ABC transporter substrate-binding protein [Candidatus Woesearchaeota archaeon]|jgi:branched-chain amino acid transport system substrate-binding protein|nr:ABC transporter substrate-binding protein [Candidatus Woesearchaeota archaeon]MDP7198622.1 ABC transporter substrate-binding protein [Candidatus Woesearchaeota archaeon]MDP7466636.1 ABC transporter substrate-binding protein [Candidatus Woesearchaeota archaeon]MDP7646892.1 ABC transporter substrate-binding protein [Candidatus Woesearchaeota archaeon]
MKWKGWTSLIIILIFLVWLIGTSINNQTEEVYTIGSIQALTSDVASIANRVRQGIDLAVEDLNLEPGVKIRVLHDDGKCDPPTGIAAYQKLVAVDHIHALIGPTCSSSAMAVAPIAEENKMVMMATVSSVPALKDAGDYIFRNRVSGGPHGVQMAEHTYNVLGKRKAAILFINQDNGVGYRDAFTKRFEALGGKVLTSQPYDKGEIDYRTPVLKAQQGDPDVLYVGGQQAEMVVKQVREMEWDVPIVGTLGFEVPEMLTVAGKHAEGVLYTNPAFDPDSGDPVVATFQAKYEAKYGEKAAAFDALAYDGAMLVGKALRACKGESDCMRDYLYAVKDYAGVSGTTTFDEYGEVAKPLVIKTVRNGEFVLLT